MEDSRINARNIRRDIKRRVLIAVAVLGTLAYMGIALATDTDQLGNAMAALGWGGSGFVLGLSLINYLLRFYRWELYLSKLSNKLPYLKHCLYYLSGFAFTVSPAKAGEAMRSVYLRDHGVTYADSIATLFVERLLDLAVMVMLASLIVVDNPPFRPLLIGVSAMVLLMVILAGHPFLPNLLNRWSEKHPGGRATKLADTVANLLTSSQRLLQLQPLLLGTLLGLVSWGAEGLGFHLICQGFDLHLNTLEAIGIYAVSALAGSAAILLPAGIGGMEVVMTTLLVARGASLSVAIIATLLCRLATLWFAVLIGLATTAILELGFTRERASTTS